MPRSLPVIPGGRTTSAPFSSCSPSGRVILIESGLKAPALVLSGAAAKAGAKGRSARLLAQLPPPGALVRTMSSPGCAGGLPVQGVNVDVARFGPHVGELLSTAWDPPLKLRSKEVKGTCGVSETVVVSC